jgi:hypothetical protein
MSVLTAYVSLASVLGDQFASAGARGRRDYGHPDQLGALVLSGFTTKNSALWDTKAVEIPAEAEQLFLQAESVSSLEAYYMFVRGIKGWSTQMR